MKLILTVLTLLGASVAHTAELRIVPTFECAGLYWRPSNGADSLPCVVRFREVSASSDKWRDGFPLWYDQRSHSWGGEYRGSIVHLRPNTSYEVEVRAGDEFARATFQTWSNQFPAGKTHAVAEKSIKPLLIQESGTAAGYLIYEPSPHKSAAIDVGDRHANCIRIEDASYIVIRGLSLRGAASNAIELVGDVHDIVIEDCDISGWGRVESDGWGRNYESAVFSRSRTARRIIVQNNRIHHPRGDSNNWTEHRPRPRDPDNYHPVGPQAIYLAESQGNHVIRYNSVYSDDDHQFNDIFGAAQNYSTKGFPNCDSDIYGNRLSHCWDDAIESEGANQNVRIWGNYSEKTMVHVASATTSIGPLYIWKNIAGETRQGADTDTDKIKRGGFLKTSDRMGGGRIYLFHNTLLQPPPPPGFRNTLGCQIGMGFGGPMLNIHSRNNLFHTSAKGGPFNDRTHDPNGDYDHDMYNGRLMIDAHERHGIVGVPLYEPLEKDSLIPFPFIPSVGSASVDAGVRLLNFNDDFTGSAPDLGAYERGTKVPKVGVAN